MTTRLSSKTFAQIVASVAFAAITLGCASTMGSDGAGEQMSAGLAQTRSGLAQTRTGVDTITAGSRSTGMKGITDGIGMMGQGVSGTRQGMGMMSGNMMMSCADGGSDTILEPMQQAMDEMQLGRGMLDVDASTNDDEGMAHMKNGMSRMQSALDRAQGSMNCMGHNGMRSGGMM